MSPALPAGISPDLQPSCVEVVYQVGLSTGRHDDGAAAPDEESGGGQGCQRYESDTKAADMTSLLEKTWSTAHINYTHQRKW